MAFGLVNQYYWYRMRAEIGEPRTIHSQITTFAPHDPGYVLDIAPAAVLRRRRRRRAQRFLAFIVSKQGQEIIAHSISFEYPIASGVTTARPRLALDQLQPNAITISGSGPRPPPSPS